MKLIVSAPDSYPAEREYIFSVILKEFLGLDYVIQKIGGTDVCISDQDKKRRLVIPDGLFAIPQDKWLTKESMPKQPLEIWDPCTLGFINSVALPSVPVIYGAYNVKLMHADDHLCNDQEIWLPIDIFGSSFFMLTRYEEYVNPKRDQHDRFPATESLAYQECFLERPIINEYIDLLWACLNKLLPGLKRRERRFQAILSHDVDTPFAQAFSGIPQLIRNCGGDIIRRKSPALALKRALSWKAIKQGNHIKDINYTFDRIMAISEKHNLKSAFYFKTFCTDPLYDDEYPIEHHYIRQLMSNIHKRGHEIGIHPSYNTYKDEKQTKLEFEKLLKVCKDERIIQEKWGGRQHFLRWRVPLTWSNWSKAGIDYDSTLTYAEHAGFRCGACYEYPVFDLVERKPLPLIEYPLIVMEGSILADTAMGLQGQKALDAIIMLKDRCKKYNGNFTLLWHNNSLIESGMWPLYEAIVSA